MRHNSWARGPAESRRDVKGFRGIAARLAAALVAVKGWSIFLQADNQPSALNSAESISNVLPNDAMAGLDGPPGAR
jgi:hypothetical protein